MSVPLTPMKKLRQLFDELLVIRQESDSIRLDSLVEDLSDYLVYFEDLEPVHELTEGEKLVIEANEVLGKIEFRKLNPVDSDLIDKYHDEVALTKHGNLFGKPLTGPAYEVISGLVSKYASKVSSIEGML